MRRSRWWAALALPVLAACAQVINADFDGLLPMGKAGAGGNAGDDPVGPGGSAGDVAPAAGAAGMSGSGGAGGLGGSGGNAMKDASADQGNVGGSVVVPDATTPDTGAPDHGDAEPPDVGSDGPPPCGLVLNEIKGIGGGDDWVELLNTCQTPFVLDGFALTQASGDFGPPDMAASLTFPASTTLDGGAYLFVLAQQATIGGPVATCAGLAATCFNVTWGISSSAGERVYILNPSHTVYQQVDYLAPTSGGPASGQTLSRAANGTYQNATPTPNMPNGI